MPPLPALELDALCPSVHVLTDTAMLLTSTCVSARQRVAAAARCGLWPVSRRSLLVLALAAEQLADIGALGGPRVCGSVRSARADATGSETMAVRPRRVVVERALWLWHAPPKPSVPDASHPRSRAATYVRAEKVVA